MKPELKSQQTHPKGNKKCVFERFAKAVHAM